MLDRGTFARIAVDSQPSYYSQRLQLASCKIQNHLSASYPGCPPQSGEVQCTGEGIGISKTQHGWDPTSRILKSKATLRHFVLLDHTTGKVVDSSLGIDFWLIRSWGVCQLSARQDVEIVIRSMTTSVSFGANGRTKNDEILSDT